MGFKTRFLGSVRERRVGCQRKKISNWVCGCGFDQVENAWVCDYAFSQRKKRRGCVCDENVEYVSGKVKRGHVFY